ncbi:hypothetical protein AURDEDRAFT_113108 [Auricularia subglabra TFB-10046 SS5]|nr:hypothetical protein AURDEDRAFT_113108 [Auricularia subglabra TFB-10046 SS5]
MAHTVGGPELQQATSLSSPKYKSSARSAVHARVPAHSSSERQQAQIVLRRHLESLTIAGRQCTVLANEAKQSSCRPGGSNTGGASSGRNASRSSIGSSRSPTGHGRLGEY